MRARWLRVRRFRLPVRPEGIVGGGVEDVMVEVLAGESFDSPPARQRFVDPARVGADLVQRLGEEGPQVLLAARGGVGREASASGIVDREVCQQVRKPVVGGVGVEVPDFCGKFAVTAARASHRICACSSTQRELGVDPAMAASSAARRQLPPAVAHLAK